MKSSVSLTCLAVVVYACVVSSNALGVVGRGRCPRVVGQATLDVSRYLGQWYEYERFPAVFEAGLDCTSANYGAMSDGRISVNNAGYFRASIFGRGRVRRRDIRGNATVPDPSRPAELAVAFFPGQRPTVANYFIVDTDYENYSVVYSCAESEALGFNMQFAWILTRERGQAPAGLDQLRETLSSRGVDTRRFFVVGQDQCPDDRN